MDMNVKVYGLKVSPNFFQKKKSISTKMIKIDYLLKLKKCINYILAKKNIQDEVKIKTKKL